MNSKTLKPLQDYAVSGNAPLLWIDADPARALDLWEEADYRLDAVCGVLSELSSIVVKDADMNVAPKIAAALSILADDARTIHMAAYSAFVSNAESDRNATRRPATKREPKEGA